MPQPNFSLKAYNLMIAHGFHEAAKAYEQNPGRFSKKENLEKAWTSYHKSKLN